MDILLFSLYKEALKLTYFFDIFIETPLLTRFAEKKSSQIKKFSQLGLSCKNYCL